MSDTPSASSPTDQAEGGARDLQARLYREIGISAVAAALRFMKQPEPVMPATWQTKPPVARKDIIAA